LETAAAMDKAVVSEKHPAAKAGNEALAANNLNCRGK
jgi:hypothetical protein